jgi:hypothetical protein
VSDDAFHAYVALLTLSGLVLSVLAARGFGQSTPARTVDGVVAAVFLGYAGYLVIAAPRSVLVLSYAFLAPAFAVAHVVRTRHRARGRTAPADRSGPPAPVGAAPRPPTAPRHRRADEPAGARRPKPRR